MKFLQLSYSDLKKEGFYSLKNDNTKSPTVHSEKGVLCHIWMAYVCRVCSLLFFSTEKKINKLAFGCTDFFFVVEILGCCGRKPLPILAQMLIVFCNSSCCHCDVLSCVLFVLSPRLKWLLITYRAAAKKWAIWYSFLLFSVFYSSLSFSSSFFHFFFFFL